MSGFVDIARKTTACRACRKRKVRCHLVNECPPCARCKNRGIECTFNKNIDTLLEDDVEWKRKLEKRLDIVERSLKDGVISTAAPIAHDVSQMREEISTSIARTRVSNSLLPRNDRTELNLSCSLSSFPAVSINGNTQDDSPHAVSGSAAPDSSQTSPGFLPQKLLTGTSAEELFSLYQENLNPLIHYVLANNESLAGLRTRSEFLAVAVCTVAACYKGTPDHAQWLELYKSLASARTFANQHAFDDVRALCIGALWLTHMSTALNALAVRISSELNLHRCLTKVPFTNIQCYERTRLYLLVYIVDHHCTLCYGRPPMARELSSTEPARAFLASKFANPDRGDSSLISQVELWSINAKVFDAFGADIERTSPSYVSKIDYFSRLYDDWLNDWRPILSPMSHLLRDSRHQINTTLTRTADHAFNLYLSAARLQLFSHVFRGPSQRTSNPPITMDNREGLSKFSNQAIQSAIAQIDELTYLVCSGTSFGILPTYLATTIAFSSVFIARVLTTQRSVILSEQERTKCIETIERLSDFWQEFKRQNTTDITAGSTSQVLLSRIVNALNAAKQRSRGDNEDPSIVRFQETCTSPHNSHELFDISEPNVFDIDMSLDFDFNFLDEDCFAWDQDGGQGIQT